MTTCLSPVALALGSARKSEKSSSSCSSDMEIDDIKFSIERKNCDLFAGEDPELRCLANKVSIIFANGLGEEIEKKVDDFNVDLNGQRLLIEKAGSTVILQGLRSCTDLSGL